MRLACLVWVLIGILVAPVAAQEKDAVASSGYRVGAGDVLRVEAYNHDEISGNFAVEVAGEISFPMLGRVEVAGQTTSEIANHLERLLEQDYYVDVQLQVEIEDYHSKPVTVLGEVARPGTYYLEGKTSLHKILATNPSHRPARHIITLAPRAVSPVLATQVKEEKATYFT